jgi:hypothetical protein
MRGVEATRWVCAAYQEVGDDFLLDMTKSNGEGRMLESVTLVQGRDFALQYPVEYKITVAGRDGIFSRYDYTQRESRVGEGIHIQFHPAEKVCFIGIVIVTPRAGFYWALEDIRMKEVRIPLVWKPKRLSRDL